MSTSSGRRTTWTTMAALWFPGLLVGVAACVATAHGLYEVALGAGVPRAMAWLYPLITDGLALVAYATTARLVERGRTYAWCVVVLAAGLSGIAQASYLSGGFDSAPSALRFGVGAWPAIAAAIVAHLLFLLGHTEQVARSPETPAERVQAIDRKSGQKAVRPGVQDGERSPRPSPERRTSPPVQPAGRTSATRPPGAARERARTAAHQYAAEHGALPTVTQLMGLSDVARGTAGNALKELREQRTQVHLVNNSTPARTDQ
jgi:uncharacterized protein DUF2637